jgi:transcriptional regulator with XRE-family HTH domain
MEKREAKKRPHAAGLTLSSLRQAYGVSRKELAAALGLKDDDLLAKQERGDRDLSRATLDWEVAPLSPLPEEVEALLFAHRIVLPEGPPEPGLTAAELRAIDRTALAVAWTAAQTVRRALVDRTKSERAAAELREAEEMWERLKPLSLAKRRDLVTAFPRYRTCALVARVCEASTRAAAHRPAEALELAEFAGFIAERVRGGERRRLRASGYAHGFIANAQRVATDFDAADATFLQAWLLWHAGTATDHDPLQEWRLLSLEASLLRAHQHFSAALDLLDRARAACGDCALAIGRILMQKSNVLEQSGDFAGALAALEEAAPAIEASGDRQLLFFLYINRATDLCLLERYSEAVALLPAVRELGLEGRNEIMLYRVLWLEARIAAGQGRSAEAVAALELVRRDFTVIELPYEAALSSLDLAVLWLEQGRPAQVRELAVGMVWIFSAKGIDREALAALALFCEAARQETATVELGRRVIADIEKVRRLATLR